MKPINTNILMTALCAGAAMTITVACNSPAPVLPHKLVATGGQHTVPLYPDEQSFLKVSHSAQQGGVTGMVGDVQKNFTAKQIDDQTPVKVLSSDSNGSEVEITQGPMNGQAGFVANQNVD
jgi:hypothetical protein